MCTAGSNIQKFYFLPTQRVYNFYGCQNKQRLILCTVWNYLFCITKTVPLHCALDTESFKCVQYNIAQPDRTMAESVSYCGGPHSIPGQPTWDLWYTKWYSDRFFSEYFSFPLSVSLHRCSIIIIIIIIFLSWSWATCWPVPVSRVSPVPVTHDVAGRWPATSWVHYTTHCNAQSSAPEDG